VSKPVEGLEVEVVEQVSEEKRKIIEEAGTLLSSAADLSTNAHKLLTQAEEMRAKAYLMLEGMSSDPMARLLLQADLVQFPDGIEGNKSLKQLKREFVQGQESKSVSKGVEQGEGSGIGKTKPKAKKGSDGPKVVKKRRSNRKGKGRRLSTGSVVSVGEPIHGYVVPDDFPSTWPLRYRPKYIGGGPRGGRIYICQYPGCGRHISKLDPSWTHLAVKHMRIPAKCPLCGKGYNHPGSMRAHMRRHK
jgi:hypothetical protein